MFLIILGLPAFQLRSKIDKKASQDRSKLKHKFGQHLDPFFDGFWYQLGSILGGFCRPSWSHVGTKWHQSRTQKSIKKIITLWEASGTNFNEFLVDLGANLGGTNVVVLEHFWLLGPSWGHHGPKTPPRAPQEAPRAPKSLILKGFWKIFG